MSYVPTKKKKFELFSVSTAEIFESNSQAEVFIKDFWFSVITYINSNFNAANSNGTSFCLWFSQNYHDIVKVY
jgi:hypothetical protein